MPQVIKTPDTKIVTKNGECQLSISVEPIVIEITLNINGDGTVSMASTKEKPKPAEDPTNWIVPDFGARKVKFGKSVGD